MKTAEEKVIELEGLGVDVSRHGASWVLQCGQRHLRVADVVRVHPSDVAYLLGNRRQQASETRYRDLARTL